jgi:hypothetical protein
VAPRPNGYHPDHRYTGILVQDAAYMLVAPDIVPEAPALRRSSIFLYYGDNFEKPAPFRPDVAVSIDDVWKPRSTHLTLRSPKCASGCHGWKATLTSSGTIRSAYGMADADARRPNLRC